MIYAVCRFPPGGKRSTRVHAWLDEADSMMCGLGIRDRDFWIADNSSDVTPSVTCPNCARLLAEHLRLAAQDETLAPNDFTARFDAGLVIGDGCGVFVDRKCPTCHHYSMQIVRPGKAQCWRCG